MKCCSWVVVAWAALVGTSAFAQERARGDREGAIQTEGTDRGGQSEEARLRDGRRQAAGEAEREGQPDRRARFQARLRELVAEQKLNGDEARELLQLAFPREAGDAAGMRQPPNARDRNSGGRRLQLEVKDPAGFAELQDTPIFSGPQVGEKLPALQVRLAVGDKAGSTMDPVAAAEGKPQVLIFQDPTEGLRGLVAFSRLLTTIRKKSKLDLDATVVFVGDDPTAITEMVGRLKPHAGEGLIMAYSPDGRDGPGSYGLNRSMVMTVLLAREGQVVHNFVLPQGMATPDPHVLGGVAELIDVAPDQLASWLGDGAAEASMRRGPREGRRQP